MGKHGMKNLFGKSKDFFDKEATIKEYFALVPPEQRKKCETYDELFEEALKYVTKQDFEKNTEDQVDYFHELTVDEGIIAVGIGLSAFFVAYEVDFNGKTIEKAINDVLSKDYDTNNPFDVRRGRRHRIFGHDLFTFGVKNIPADTLIKVNGHKMKIGDFLGVGTDGKVCMWDLIWKFYGEGKSPLKGIFSCLGHTIAHLSKDLFTPDGLPLPFTSLFEKYGTKEVVIDGELEKVSWIDYKDSVMKKVDKLHMELKASDIASLVFIEALIEVYLLFKKKELGNKINELRTDIKLLAMGTCIAMQMGTILTSGQLSTAGKSSVPGGKANAIMMGAFMKLTIQEMWSIFKARHEINKEYKSDYMRGYYSGK